LEMGFKLRAISHGLNRVASTVKRAVGRNGAQRPARSHDDC
jgi:IS30 family transposase